MILNNHIDENKSGMHLALVHSESNYTDSDSSCD